MHKCATDQSPDADVATGLEGYRDPVTVSVIVPTYCEAENLPLLVPRVAKAIVSARLKCEIVIVDDNSPDNTRQVCEQLAVHYPIRLIVRERDRGLSSAVLHGMQYATSSVLVVMDADLSHPPEKIPDLVKALLSGDADFVIGSRYVNGGGTAEDWGVFRRLNSQVATLLAWPLSSAKDPMAGFFAIQRKTFEAGGPYCPVGYKIGLELIVKCDCKHVKEVPIEFANRLHGASKLSLKEQFDFLRHLKRLYEYRLGRLARPLQFVLVGSTGMVVDLSSFALLLSFLSMTWARALAIWIAMSWNFWFNRRLTFSYARIRSPRRQYVLFCFSCLLGAMMNWGVSVGLCSSFVFFSQWKVLAASFGVLAGTVFNYLLSAHFVFQHNHNKHAEISVTNE